MKEGIKMSGFLIGIVIGAVIIYCGILYVRKVEKRSFLSYLMERLLFLFVKPLAYSKDEPAKFEQELNKLAKGNDVPITNPKKYIKVDVQEKDVDGMQVFVWNDNKEANQKVILFLHGGAYVLQPSMMHFTLVHKIARAIDAKVISRTFRRTYKSEFYYFHGGFCRRRALLRICYLLKRTFFTTAKGTRSVFSLGGYCNG